VRQGSSSRNNPNSWLRWNASAAHAHLPVRQASPSFSRPASCYPERRFASRRSGLSVTVTSRPAVESREEPVGKR
jgi:hypothetical protein